MCPQWKEVEGGGGGSSPLESHLVELVSSHVKVVHMLLVVLILR